MKNWIRWQGIGAFAGVVVILSLFWLIFIDGIVKQSIEKYGTKSVGARVELADADLKLFPAGLTLKGLAVTNPDKPMENIVEITEAALSLDTMNLLRRKIIVDEMSLRGIRINTPRKTSGAIVVSRKKQPDQIQKTPTSTFCDNFSLPSLNMLDVHRILSQEKLESVELIQGLQKEIQAENNNWQKRLQELPGKEKFDDYRKRIEELKSGDRGISGGFLGSVGNLSSLQQELQSDLDRLKGAQKQFDQLKSGLAGQLQKASRAPLKDVERLKQKYALSPQGLDNLAKLVLGQKFCNGLQKAASWYERVKSVMGHSKSKSGDKKEVPPDRGVGTDIRFKEVAPLPDFLVRRTFVSFLHETGELSGKIENITPDQDILGLPLTFVFSGEKLQQLNTVKLEGTINRVDPEKPMDRVNMQLKEYKVRNTYLSQSAELPALIKEGLVDIDLRASLEGSSLNSNLTAELKSANLSAEIGADKGPVLSAIGAALSQLSGFNVKAVISGSLNDYQIRLSSDLDQTLKSAAGKIIQQQSEKFGKELEQAVLAKVGGPLDQLKTDKNSLDAIGSHLTERLNMGSGLLGNLKRPF